MSVSYRVVIRCYEIDKIVKVVASNLSERRAEKIDAGVNINLNHEKFFTLIEQKEVVEQKEKGCRNIMTMPGDKVCTVGRLSINGKQSGGKRPNWTGAIYVVRERKDGVLTWQRDGSFGEGRAGRAASAELIAILRRIAPHPWRDNVFHGGQVEEEEKP